MTEKEYDLIHEEGNWSNWIIHKHIEFENRVVAAIGNLDPVAHESLKLLLNEYIQDQKAFKWNLTDQGYLKQRKRIEQFFEDNCGIKLTLTGSFFYSKNGIMLPCTQLITIL